MPIATRDVRRALASVLSPISAVPVDRQGDPIFYDDFSDGLVNWGQTVSGDGAAITLSAARARSLPFSVLLTGGSTLLFTATLDTFFNIPRVGRMGMELSFALPGTILQLFWAIQYFDGTNLTLFELRWRDAENDLQYRDSAGAFQTFATGVDLSTQARLFHTGKLVVDTSTGQYVRFLLDRTLYTTGLAGNAAEQRADAAPPTVRLFILLASRAGQNDTCYVDDFMATVNEPA